MVTVDIESLPLGRVGKLLLAANWALAIVLVVVPLYYRSVLPDIVPTHFGDSGKAITYGSRDEVLALLAIVMPIANVAVVSISMLRFSLIRKYPFTINLPSFVVLLASGKLDAHERGQIVNGIFEVTLLTGALIGLFLLGLEILILNSMATGHLAWLGMVILVTAMPVTTIMITLILYRRIYEKLKQRLSA